MTKRNYLTVLTDVIQLSQDEQLNLIVDIINHSKIEKTAKGTVVLKIIKNVDPNLIKSMLSIINLRKKLAKEFGVNTNEFLTNDEKDLTTFLLSEND